MLTKEKATEIIKTITKNGILSFAKKTANKKATFQVLDLLIPNERKIRNIVGGLETSLGTTLWEPLAKALAKENGFEVVNSKLLSPEHIPSSVNNILQNIIDDRSAASKQYNAKTSHEAIKNVCQIFVDNPVTVFKKPPRGKGVDIWLRKDNVNYLFDTKTVQPNISAFTSYMTQVLYWYAYFYTQYPTQQAEARIVFPYNPHGGNFWTSTKGQGKPLERSNEGWVENDFWNFCTGLDDTYDLIKQSFIDLRDSGELESELNRIFYS